MCTEITDELRRILNLTPEREKRINAMSEVFGIIIKIREHMEQHNISVEQLAKNIGIGPSKVRQMLDYDPSMPISSLFLLAEGIGCKIVCVPKPDGEKK